MKKIIILFFFIGITTPVLRAQLTPEPCYFNQTLSNKLAESSTNTDLFNDINNKIDQLISFNNSIKLPGDIYIIPVVVHVIHLGEAVGTGTNISDAQINSAITNLTDTYRNAFGNSIDNNIEFQLAVRNPDCNTTTGIVRVDGSGVPNYAADGVSIGGPGAIENDVKDLSKWPTDQYMNFWIVTEIDGNNGGFGTQGYANFPFAGDPYNGAVMMASIFGYDPTNAQPSFNLNAPGDNSTAIHEVGHFLSLFHTFQGDGGGGACPGNITVGTDSDGCADTPPHMRNASTCPADGTNNPCTGGNLDEVKLNYMDYSSCPVKFTSDQKDRMRACLEGPRLSLITSLALTPPTGTFTPPIAATCTPNTQAAGLGGGFGGITSVIFSNLNSPTSSSDIDGGYKDFTGECLKVAYVELNQVVPLTINTWFNNHNVKVWIDYNNNGDFSDPGEEVFNQSLTGGTPMTQNVTIPAIGGATIDTHLRMRVLGDLNAIPNSCTDPEFGQAEDYVVYITNPITAVPVADFSIDDITPCINQDVTFDDLSTNTPTSWAWEITPTTGWSYIGGTTANSENPQVTFTTIGNYDVQLIATNASGSDTEIKTTYISVQNSPTVTLTPTNASCGLTNGQITAVVTGNITVPTFAWASGSITDTQTGLGAGIETLVVTADGCVINVDETLTATGTISVTLTPTNASCGLTNGQITAVVTGNIAVPTFAWASGSTTDTQTGLGAGNETVVITVDGCTINENETLTATGTIAVNLTPTNASCGMNNGQIVAVVTGNINPPIFAWTSGSTTNTQTGLGAGLESVVITVDGCTINESQTLTATGTSGAITVDLTPTHASCGLNNGQVIAIVTGNVTTPIYTWTSGSTTDTQTGLGAGTETVVITVDGCTITESETLTASATPTVNLTSTNASCGIDNGQITAVVSGNTGTPTFVWASGSTTDTQTGLAAGTETVVITVDGCTINESETLTASATPTLTLTATNATCGLNNGQITAIVTGNTSTPTYTWSSGSTTSIQTGLGAGNETLVVLADGCTINANETITTTNAANAGNLTGLSIICSGTTPGIIDLANNNGNVVNWIYSTDQINWSVIDSTSNSIFANSIVENTWFGAVVALNNCPTDTSFIEINTTPLPYVYAGEDQSIDLGYSTHLEGETTELSYHWLPTINVEDNLELTTLVTPSETTTYTLYATDSNDCENSDSTTITVLTDWDYMTGIHIPNGFSPNNDGQNDYLDIFVGGDVKSFNFILVDRWGHVIFNTDTDDYLWDGSYKSKPVNTGVFAYTVEVNLNDGSSEVISGNVTVIR